MHRSGHAAPHRSAPPLSRTQPHYSPPPSAGGSRESDMARMRAVLVLAAVLPGLAHIPSLRVRSSYRDAGLRHMREQYRGAALPIDQWFTQVRAGRPSARERLGRVDPEGGVAVAQHRRVQTVDHFDALNTDTWQQRYWANEQYWAGACRVFGRGSNIHAAHACTSMRAHTRSACPTSGGSLRACSRTHTHRRRVPRVRLH